jgi:hypothetical protein
MKYSKFFDWILLFFTIISTFLVCEYVAENFLIKKVPIKFQFSLPNGLAVLAQSSKAERIPKDYIAIAGDSYAQGKGDWLLEINPNSNNAFNSAHVLNQLTDRDVINFGKVGASNIGGWVKEPIAKYQFIHDKIDESFVQPNIILAYFYAGNDLADNVIQLHQDFIPKYGESALSKDEIWQKYFIKEIKNRKVGPYKYSLGNLGWFPKSVYLVLKNEIKHKTVDKKLGDIHIQTTGEINRVLVNGKEVSLPDRLQAPSLELNSQDTELGFLALSHSLKYLKHFFNNSQIVVVYIPSVLESYSQVSEKIGISSRETANEKLAQEIYSTSELMKRSDELTERVKSIATEQGLKFIDTRPQIRAASSQQMIHGPIDWKHYNRKGYEALAQSVACGLVELNLIKDSIKISPYCHNHG